MTTQSIPEIEVGTSVSSADGRPIGQVDAVFADYLLVRTASLLPVDLYIPTPDVTDGRDGLTVEPGPEEAYERWHRPLKRAPHADG
jgi:hypothetical protein